MLKILWLCFLWTQCSCELRLYVQLLHITWMSTACLRLRQYTVAGKYMFSSWVVRLSFLPSVYTHVHSKLMNIFWKRMTDFDANSHKWSLEQKHERSTFGVKIGCKISFWPDISRYIWRPGGGITVNPVGLSSFSSSSLCCLLVWLPSAQCTAFLLLLAAGRRQSSLQHEQRSDMLQRTRVVCSCTNNFGCMLIKRKRWI